MTSCYRAGSIGFGLDPRSYPFPPVVFADNTWHAAEDQVVNSLQSCGSGVQYLQTLSLPQLQLQPLPAEEWGWSRAQEPACLDLWVLAAPAPMFLAPMKQSICSLHSHFYCPRSETRPTCFCLGWGMSFKWSLQFCFFHFILYLEWFFSNINLPITKTLWGLLTAMRRNSKLLSTARVPPGQFRS